MHDAVVTPGPMPSKGCVVHCRSHRWLVEEVEPPELPGGDTVVRMACLDDDANGQQLEVFWEREVDARVEGETTWDTVGQRGFDRPQVFGSYMNTLRWNCVTSTDPGLFQAPLRAGIDVKPYQLEPLRKALRMPRVSLFIADDVGLGKTIEAGLIMRELLLRQKVHRVVVVAPPSVVLQWKGEMESRFGLAFAVMDRAYISEMRRQRGWGINPWATHTRFIVSQALVRDEAYAGPLRDWLGDEGKQALLILDEAHNAAPASGSKFAIDSKLTNSIRDIAKRFEHKLFLSATPHNGHSNSFSALLEILDPTRFCRGVAVRKVDLEDVMVRRLKEDLRQIGVELPQRLVTPEVIDGLPPETPELKLAELLSRYREQRNQRLAAASKRERAAENLVISNLPKRLLNSIAAFERTLQVHMSTLEKRAAKAGKERQIRLDTLDLLQNAIDGDDERAECDEEELLLEADAQHEAAVISALEASEEELVLLREMEGIAKEARYRADCRVQGLEELIREHLSPQLGRDGATWNNERLLIFAECAATDCFETFHVPAALLDANANDPADESTHQSLEAISERYHQFRSELMVQNNEALTSTYNRFNDPSKTSPELLKLRRLHGEMDQAVLQAYGWSDVSTACGFGLDYLDTEEDAQLPEYLQKHINSSELSFWYANNALDFQAHMEASGAFSGSRKLPWRYRWPNAVRDDVLARLLALNAERYAEEVAMGLHSNSAKKTSTIKRGRKPKATNAQRSTFQLGPKPLQINLDLLGGR